MLLRPGQIMFGLRNQLTIHSYIIRCTTQCQLWNVWM